MAKHIIVGTAGHVDHGKTTLIRALTGMETDRHPEERERGMSMDLGFAHLTLPSGIVAGIVDVPGHERFVHNMLAGAAEMDMVLFIVAADEGVMPQTIEHLEILQLLHAKRGVIVLTKCDLVGDDWLELVKEDVAERVRGTFLDGAPMIAVSAVTGEGLDELVRVMDAVAQEVPPKATDRPFRLPIDDTFVKAGFGTIVRGAIFSGQVRVGEEVEVVPKGIVTRVRSLHTYGKPTEIAVAGQRAAMNLGGVERETTERGDVVCHPTTLRASDRMDVALRLLPSAPRPLKDGAPVRFHIGTAERIGRVFFFDRNELKPSEETFAEIRLDKPVACAWGDLFVIRSYSPMVTLGGGKVIEPHPLQRRRRRVAEEFHRIAEKSRSEKDFVVTLLREHPNGVTVREIAQRLFLSTERARQIAEALIAEGVAFSLDGQTLLWQEQVRRLQDSIIVTLRRFHTERPLRRGMPKETLRSLVAPDMAVNLFETLLQHFAQISVIVVERETVRLPTHEIRLTEEQRQWAERMERKAKTAGFAPPELEELLAEFPDREQAMDLLSWLVEQGRLVRVAEFVVHPETIERAKQLARQLCERYGSFTASQFREAANTTRKYAVPLLEFLDQLGVTVRRGDVRVLRGT
jgi:selenocysteine-specific elongation factor